MRRLIALFGAFVALGGVSTAEAGRYPGERNADNQLWAAVEVATGYWAARGLTGCSEGVRAYWADSLADIDGVDAIARGQGCTVWFEVAHFKRARRQAWSAWYRWRRASVRAMLREECATVVHEVGHALGWKPAPGQGVDEWHAKQGVMSPYGDGMPRECRAWARSVA